MLKQPGFSPLSESSSRIFTEGYSRVLEVSGKRFRPLLPGIFVLMFLWMAVALIPLEPLVPDIGLDSSWAYALNLAHVQNLTFGKDVVFTFGPLGYLFYPVPEMVAPLPAFALGWAVMRSFSSARF